MKLKLSGRPISKKNSKLWIIRGGRRLLVPSVAYQRFAEAAAYQLKPQLTHTIQPPYQVHCNFYLKGKIHADGDNLFTSILDILQAIAAIDDDDLVMSGSWTKYPGVREWGTHIYLLSYMGEHGKRKNF